MELPFEEITSFQFFKDNNSKIRIDVSLFTNQVPIYQNPNLFPQLSSQPSLSSESPPSFSVYESNAITNSSSSYCRRPSSSPSPSPTFNPYDSRRSANRWSERARITSSCDVILPIFGNCKSIHGRRRSLQHGSVVVVIFCYCFDVSCGLFYLFSALQVVVVVRW